MDFQPSTHLTDNLTDKRLTDLEIKVSFTEDLLDELNRVVVRQQEQIDRLMREVVLLRQQTPEASQSGGNASTSSRARDELPPHY